MSYPDIRRVSGRKKKRYISNFLFLCRSMVNFFHAKASKGRPMGRPISYSHEYLLAFVYKHCCFFPVIFILCDHLVVRISRCYTYHLSRKQNEFTMEVTLVFRLCTGNQQIQKNPAIKLYSWDYSIIQHDENKNKVDYSGAVQSRTPSRFCFTLCLPVRNESIISGLLEEISRILLSKKQRI